MLTSRELLDAARERAGFPTNAALSRFLGVPDRTLQRWKMRKHTPDDDMAARLAKLAGFDEGVVLAAMAAQRATDDEGRARWANVADRLSRAAVACLVASVGLVGSPAPAQAAPLANGAAGSIPGLCIMSTRRTRALGSRLRALLSLPPLPAWISPAPEALRAC